MIPSTDMLYHLIIQEIDKQNLKHECNKYLDQYLCRERTPKSQWVIKEMK